MSSKLKLNIKVSECQEEEAKIAHRQRKEAKRLKKKNLRSAMKQAVALSYEEKRVKPTILTNVSSIVKLSPAPAVKLSPTPSSSGSVPV